MQDDFDGKFPDIEKAPTTLTCQWPHLRLQFGTVEVLPAQVTAQTLNKKGPHMAAPMIAYQSNSSQRLTGRRQVSFRREMPYAPGALPLHGKVKLVVVLLPAASTGSTASLSAKPSRLARRVYRAAACVLGANTSGAGATA